MPEPSQDFYALIVGVALGILVTLAAVLALHALDDGPAGVEWDRPSIYHQV